MARRRYTSFSVKRRARVSSDGIRVKAYSEPVHRAAAEQIACLKPMPDNSGPVPARAEGRGVMLLYPTHHFGVDEPAPDEFVPTMGFALLFPKNSLPQRIAFKTRTQRDVAFVQAEASDD